MDRRSRYAVANGGAESNHATPTTEALYECVVGASDTTPSFAMTGCASPKRRRSGRIALRAASKREKGRPVAATAVALRLSLISAGHPVKYTFPARPHEIYNFLAKKIGYENALDRGADCSLVEGRTDTCAGHTAA